MNNILYSKKNPLGYTQGIFCLKTLTLLLVIFFVQSISAQAKLEVNDAKKNFGIVNRGEVIKNEYEIINSGNQPLLISDVEISCSCTLAEFPRKPIIPGQKEKILVIFNTGSVYGRQDRTVLVISNDPAGPVKLRYKGIVKNTK